MFLGFRHIKFFLEIFWSIFSVRSIIQLFCWKNSNSKNTLKAPIMFVWTALNKKMKFFNHKIILQSILWRIFMKFSNKSFDGFWYCWKIWFLNYRETGVFIQITAFILFTFKKHEIVVWWKIHIWRIFMANIISFNIQWYGKLKTLFERINIK